jgi:hypothetical protein
MTRGIKTGDFNGDGKADILASQRGANPGLVTLQLGGGNGTFTSGGTIYPLSGPQGFAVADFNGDTRLDFVIAEEYGSRVTSYLGRCGVPTAASVSIGGRVLTAAGRGLMNATVYLTNQNGETLTRRTSSLGYYRFDDIVAGQTVIVNVVSKRYQFTPQTANVTEELDNLDFYSQH